MGSPAAAMLLLLPALLSSAPPEPSGAGREGAVRVFVNCTICDEAYLRTEITFVDYVRDREYADVHVLVTSQPTGTGGTEFAVRFIGRDRFEGVEQVLRVVFAPTDTTEFRRRQIAQLLRLGLVRYVAETPFGANLAITFDAPANVATEHDPWNFWVFRTGFSGLLTGQSATGQTTLNGFFNANRTTPAMRLDLRLDGTYGEQRFEIEEGQTFTSSTYSATLRGLLARALTNHWTVGLTANASTSTFLNYRLRTRVGPGIEYNFFRYPESTRRILTLFYSVGLQTLSYREETLFGRLSERRPDHRADLTFTLLQPWGTASASAGASQFLNARERYRLTGQASLNLNLFKGLSLDVSGRPQSQWQCSEQELEDLLQRELRRDGGRRAQQTAEQAPEEAPARTRGDDDSHGTVRAVAQLHLEAQQVQVEGPEREVENGARGRGAPHGGHDRLVEIIERSMMSWIAPVSCASSACVRPAPASGR